MPSYEPAAEVSTCGIEPVDSCLVYYNTAAAAAAVD